MRILITVDPEIPVPPRFYGGIERVVDGLCRELMQRGHEVGLLAHPDSTCPTHLLNSWPVVSSLGMAAQWKNTLALQKAANRFEAEIVHSFSRLAWLLPRLALRKPTVMSYQRHTGGRQISLAAKLGGSKFAFTGCSEFIAKMGRPSGGNWLGIPNFADFSALSFAPHVEPDAPLVFLSRIERIKGAHNAIDIARQAGRRLIIAGNKPEGAEHADYWQTKIEPSLGKDGIEYVGPADDKLKNELLGKALAFLAPIEWDEPFGIVFAEALACGTPVISSPRGALPYIVEQGRHGFLVTSVAEGVQAVSQVAQISRDACRQQALTRFSAQAVTTQYEELYASLLH